VYVGAALIAYTAGEMIDADMAVQPYLPHVFHGTPYLGLLLALGVTAYGRWFNLRRHRTAKDVLLADEHAMERMEDQID
jgi:hypothetical protein